MIRPLVQVLLAALVCAVLTARVGAEDPPKALSEDEKKELFAKLVKHYNAGDVALQATKLPEAEKSYEDALKIARTLYNKVDFPDGHDNLSLVINNLAHLYRNQGKLAEAALLFQEALDMTKRTFKGDHLAIATCMNNLALVHWSQGKLTEAEVLFKDSLAMLKRLHRTDTPNVVTSLSGLAIVNLSQGKLVEAELLFQEALDMTKRMFKGDHIAIATCMNGFANVSLRQGKVEKAEQFFKDSLAMRKRLYKGDHSDVAESLNNLALFYHLNGKFTESERMHKDALTMNERLHKKNHSNVANSMQNLGALYLVHGKILEAEPLITDALTIYRQLLVAHASQMLEGDALTYGANQPLTRDSLLTVARTHGAAEPRSDPARAYAAVWSAKGTIARVFEQRHLRARATTDPALAAKIARLTDARRRRADLVLAVPTKDPATLKQRDADLKALDDTIATLTRELATELPASARADKLDAASLTDIQKVLPADAALVDYIHYTQFGWDDTKPVGQKQTREVRYVAFVVTREKVTWVDLDTAASIEPALEAWRAAITSGTDIDPQVPAKVRALVWEPVRKHLTANTKTVFVCPDAALCTLPFGALPGDKPGTVALEDFAFATVPHAPFLLDQLWPQDVPTSKATGALVVGGVNFDAQVTGAKVAEPLVKPDAKRGWGALPNTVGELNGIGRLGTEKKYAVTRLDGDKATTAAVLDALPKAKVAHFATHGFFADPSFRGVFQLDEKDFQKSMIGERIGRVANNPLLMTGLVCAGANTEGTPGRGVLTGDALIDRDLSGLELAVLSACETGLGELGAGGEGVFGLQRAFHYAGAKNVVASLWKVPDAPTAALMNRFYTNLWEKNLPPIEALRQAQLHIYRNPGDIPELAKGFRGKFEEVKVANEVAAKPQGGKAHQLHWAAFSLSGTGK